MSVQLAVWLWTPLAASAAFGALAPAAARRLPARTATWLLTAGSAVLATAAVVLPGLALLTLVGQWAPLARLGHWSGRWLALGSPAGHHAWVVAAAVLGVQVPLVAVAAWRRGSPLVRAWRTARDAPGPLVVVADPRPAAFALPGWPGRIVATQGLLRVLGPDERRAVLAHEQAHLDARHDLHLAVAAVAAAAQPLLVRVPAAVRLATERWADEQAADSVGDRRLVARTIVEVAEWCQPRPAPQGSMAVIDGDVPARVRALLGPPAPRRLPVVAAAAAVALLPAVSALVAAAQTDAAFQRAELAAAAVPTWAGSIAANTPAPQSHRRTADAEVTSP